MVFRVVELGESVGEFTTPDEELEAIGEKRIGIVGPRERRHFSRIGVDEGRLHQRVFAGLLEEFDL